MITKQVTRETAFNLALALTLCKKLDVPAAFRYATNKTLPGLEAERQATIDAFPEPADKSGDEWKEWKVKLDEHMQQEVDIQVYETPLCEINDTVHVKAEQRAQQNDALIFALMPIWKES